MNGIRAADIHAQLGSSWPAVLARLGIAEEYLRPKKAGPCPCCGGSDRYTFDNRKGRGDYICRGHGAGDGFDLLERVHGWSFSEARRQVMAAAGLGGDMSANAIPIRSPAIPSPEIAKPTQRVLAVLRGSCAVADCEDAVAYLSSRGLWPLPEGCTLRAHPAVDYWDDDGRRIGRFPGIVARIVDHADELVSAHLTYLENGAKLRDHQARKNLSKMEGREGCAVRLMPAADVLGVAEGIETALSAAILHDVPTWSALNASLLAKFEPPPGIKLLIIFADRDVAGLELGAGRLMERMQGRVRFELRLPKAPAKDFNDQLTKEFPR